MDQEIPQTNETFDFNVPMFVYDGADHGDLEAFIPRIIGPGTDFTSSVGLANGYLEPPSNFYRPNESLQTYLDPSSGQFWPSGVHAPADNVSISHSPELRGVHDRLQEALSLVNELISPHQGREQNGNDDDKRFRCILCPQPLFCKNKGTFTRHITTTHYPSKRYFCHICNQDSNPTSFLRKDKHLLHMRQHGQPRMSREAMEEVTEHLPPPGTCAIAECKQPIRTWEDFINCLCRHCAIPDDWDQDNGSDGDDGDDDDNNGDGGNGGGNRYFPQSGNGNYGNTSNGGPYGHHNYDQFGDLSGRSGTNPHQYRGVANGVSSKQGGSQVLDLKDVPTGPDRAGVSQSKSTFTDLKDSQPHTKNPSALLFGNDNLCPETFRVEVPLRTGNSTRKTRSDLGMKEPQEKSGFGKQAVSISVNKEVSRELQKLRYFETCVLENQKQGSLLTYVHETFVVSQHGYFEHVIESSMQTTRRASPKKRAHLRVRVKAIAGVLALRAAVTKAPLATDNAEVGDGWELGIPYPAQDDVFKVLAWLVQVLVFFLRMPPNPRIYVMLACGTLEAPRPH
ncbi:hypothetical protein BDV09DRAFT_183951 [Aspergillus tetrazonus]